MPSVDADCRFGMTLSCGDPDDTGRRRPAARSPDTGAIEGSRELLPERSRSGARGGTWESTVLLSGRVWPVVRWVESVVIAMMGRKLAGVGCPRSRLDDITKTD